MKITQVCLVVEALLLVLSGQSGVARAADGNYPVCRLYIWKDVVAAGGKVQLVDEFLGQLLVREKSPDGKAQYCYQTRQQIDQTKSSQKLQCSPLFDETQVLMSPSKGADELTYEQGLKTYFKKTSLGFLHVFKAPDEVRTLSKANGDPRFQFYFNDEACRGISERPLRIAVAKLGMASGQFTNPRNQKIFNRPWAPDPVLVGQEAQRKAEAGFLVDSGGQ